MQECYNAPSNVSELMLQSPSIEKLFQSRLKSHSSRINPKHGLSSFTHGGIQEKDKKFKWANTGHTSIKWSIFSLVLFLQRGQNNPTITLWLDRNSPPPIFARHLQSNLISWDSIFSVWGRTRSCMYFNLGLSRNSDWQLFSQKS